MRRLNARSPDCNEVRLGQTPDPNRREQEPEDSRAQLKILRGCVAQREAIVSGTQSARARDGGASARNFNLGVSCTSRLT